MPKVEGHIAMLRAIQAVVKGSQAGPVDEQKLLQMQANLIARKNDVFPASRLAIILEQLMTACCAIAPVWPKEAVEFILEQSSEQVIRDFLNRQSKEHGWTIGKCESGCCTNVCAAVFLEETSEALRLLLTHISYQSASDSSARNASKAHLN